MSDLRVFTEPAPFPTSLLTGHPDGAGRNSSLYSAGGLEEKDFDPDILLEPESARRLAPPKTTSSRFMTKFIGWPAVVILAQVALQVIAWGFFVVVKARGPIPLPLNTAIWVKSNGHLVTLLATLAATILSGISSFLFSYAIRRSMALYLYRPMSLATLGASMANSSFLRACTVNDSGVLTINTPLYSADTQSGFAAAKGFIGQPSAFAGLGQVFNVSTAGLLPTFLHSVDASAWFGGKASIPTTTHNASRFHGNGFSSNYTMIQQGFTANVSCRSANLTSTTTPSLVYQGDQVKDWKYDDANKLIGQVTFSWIRSSCFAPPQHSSDWAEADWAYAVTVNFASSLMMIPCKTPAGYDLIVFGTGNYGWINKTVCSMSPKITTLHVDYTSEVNATIRANTVAIPDPDGAAGLAVSEMVRNIARLGQGLYSNMMGDHLVTLKGEGRFNTTQMLKVLVFRACVSLNTTFPEGIPLNMSIPTNGTLYTETMGWAYASETTRWVLIPGTLIAFSTVLVVVMALYRHAGEFPHESNQFDPSNPLHLMSAAAAGGLNDAFRGLSGKDLKEGEKLDVVLGSIPGRGPALVRADEYRSIFTDPFSPRSTSAFSPRSTLVFSPRAGSREDGA
ncbi:hypothetical protein C8R46DRAFT_1239914 [Mycena filopes]|nr:hypothetical protein C8R46DRAFT_1239914 [Mycena filopes]